MQSKTVALAPMVHPCLRAHAFRRDAEGEHLMTTIDGEVVDGGEPDMKLIESDRSDGPNDRTDGPDGSDDGA